MLIVKEIRDFRSMLEKDKNSTNNWQIFLIKLV